MFFIRGEKTLFPTIRLFDENLMFSVVRWRLKPEQLGQADVQRQQRFEAEKHRRQQDQEGHFRAGPAQRRRHQG